MKDLIFETLILEATKKVAKLVREGFSSEDALVRVAENMALDEAEVEELKVRAKKAPTPKVVEVSEDEDVEIEAPEVEDNSPHSLEFAAPDLETAVGVLMYKGIPWTNKSSTKVTFANADDVAKARDALGRRWDFINAESPTVATISFDNLEDYQKVLDFIASKRMTVVLDDNAPELSEDVDLKKALALSDHKKAKKAAKETGEAVPEAPTDEMSFKALRKDDALDISSLDPIAEPSMRSVIVAKRWK